MKTIKILFADDDLKYSMLLKRFLEAEGAMKLLTQGTETLLYSNFP